MDAGQLSGLEVKRSSSRRIGSEFELREAESWICTVEKSHNKTKRQSSASCSLIIISNIYFISIQSLKTASFSVVLVIDWHVTETELSWSFRIMIRFPFIHALRILWCTRWNANYCSWINHIAKNVSVILSCIYVCLD